MVDKRRAICLIVLTVLLAGVLAGCGAASVRELAPSEAGSGAAKDTSLDQSNAAGSPGSGSSSEEPAVDQMIIWNAEISLTVKDTQQVMDQVQAMARQLGGYTLSSESWLTDDQLNARLTIRVPADKFEDAMAQLRELGIKVNRESATSEDVTDDYVDLESRLRALEAKETQLLKFLDQAEDTEAVLAVYEQLSATQTEIEQTKGRMAYLEKLSAMATITAELLPEQAEPPVVEEGWKPLTTLRNAARTLVSTLKGLGSVVIWLVIYVLPVLLLVSVPVVLVVWIIRRLRRRSPKA